MQVTKEGYFLTRNVIRVEKSRKNKLLEFIKNHKVLVAVVSVFSSLIIIEGILINEFIKLLSFI